MKSTGWLLVLVLTLGLCGVSAPVEAQIPVTDVVHIAETIAQYAQDFYHYYEMWKSAYENIKNPVWRDLLVRELLMAALDAIQTADVSYATPGAGQVLLDAFPGPFVFASMLGEDGDLLTAEKLYVDWSKWARDVMAGSLETVSLHAQDYEQVTEDLEKLQKIANEAEGTSQNLHVANQYSGILATETLKLHQALAALVNADTVGRAYDITLGASSEETTRAWLRGEIVEEDSKAPEVPGYWPWGR